MWKEAIIEDFKKLVSYDSISFSERKTADWIISKLKDMGMEVWEDKVGLLYGGNTGNIFAKLKGNIEGPPVLFSAHMDVVEPGVQKEAIVEENGVIHSQGNTVLGADDICGILEIIYGISLIQEKKIAHRDIEVLFTIGEEVYGKGIDKFEFSKIKAKESYVLDLSGSVGSAVRKAPSIISFQVEVKGKSAHAGFEPEKGVHAISVASNAIAQIALGHVDDETTLNIGKIQGGNGTNIVPDLCTCVGEVRSYNHEKALQAVKDLTLIFETAAKEVGAIVKVKSEIHLIAYEMSENALPIRRFRKACELIGLSGEVGSTFGGSDNNILVEKGLEGIVLSCGMYKVHSTEEYTTIKDLHKGTELVAALI